VAGEELDLDEQPASRRVCSHDGVGTLRAEQVVVVLPESQEGAAFAVSSNALALNIGEGAAGIDSRPTHINVETWSLTIRCCSIRLVHVLLFLALASCLPRSREGICSMLLAYVIVLGAAQRSSTVHHPLCRLWTCAALLLCSATLEGLYTSILFTTIIAVMPRPLLWWAPKGAAHRTEQLNDIEAWVRANARLLATRVRERPFTGRDTQPRELLLNAMRRPDKAEEKMYMFLRRSKFTDQERGQIARIWGFVYADLEDAAPAPSGAQPVPDVPDATLAQPVDAPGMSLPLWMTSDWGQWEAERARFLSVVEHIKTNGQLPSGDVNGPGGPIIQAWNRLKRHAQDSRPLRHDEAPLPEGRSSLSLLLEFLCFR